MIDAESFASNPTIQKIHEYRELIEKHPSDAHKMLMYVWYVANTAPYNPFAGLPEEQKRREAAKTAGYYDIDKGTLTRTGMDLMNKKFPAVEAAIGYYQRNYVMPPEEMAGKSAMIYQRQVLKHMERLEAFADSSITDALNMEAEAEKLSNMGSLLKDASNLVKGFTVAVGHAKNVAQVADDGGNTTTDTAMSTWNKED